ncbi:MAG: hypothetical protein WCV92_01450 [Candidatus Buchananbacteria bacterium]
MAIAIMILFSGAVSADSLIPEIKLGTDATLKISGWGQIVAAEEMYGGLETDLAGLRINADLNWNDWEFFTQVNLTTDGEEIDSDWLYQAWVGHNISEHWKLRVGRIFVSGGNITPCAYDIRTVKYPAGITFCPYATGAQFEGLLLKGLTLITEVTGKSGVAFNADDTFERAEFGLMLKQEFGESGKPGYGYLAGYGQLCKDFQRYGAEGFWQPISRLTLMGALCYTKYEYDQTSDEIGGYALVAYRLLPWFELHGQIDRFECLEKTWGDVESSKDETGKVNIDYVEYCSDETELTTLTIGAKLMEPTDAFSVTVDWEKPIGDDSEEDRFLLKAQVKF